ncbi:MAG: hypothetical protein HY691_12060 [Chloroflexi bacterium]|nr:hypothetical protein [Chloroflexota bacterium]
MAGRLLPPHGGPASDRRAARLAQLAALSDDDFAAEVRLRQAARWRQGSLIRHARKHRKDFVRMLGQGFSPSALDALSRSILESWDRLFTELEPNGSVTYYFIRSLPPSGRAIIVVTRGGEIRSTFPADSLERWLARQAAVIEVTDRAERLGLSH